MKALEKYYRIESRVSASLSKSSAFSRFRTYEWRSAYLNSRKSRTAFYPKDRNGMQKRHENASRSEYRPEIPPKSIGLSRVFTPEKSRIFLSARREYAHFCRKGIVVLSHIEHCSSVIRTEDRSGCPKTTFNGRLSANSDHFMLSHATERDLRQPGLADACRRPKPRLSSVQSSDSLMSSIHTAAKIKPEPDDEAKTAVSADICACTEACSRMTA